MKKNFYSPKVQSPIARNICLIYSTSKACIFNLSFCIALLISLCGCKKDAHNDGEDTVAKIRIKDAALLFKTGSSDAIQSSLKMSAIAENGSNGNPQGMFLKQLANGEIEPVYIIKENGDSLILYIDRLREFTDQFILLDGNFQLKEKSFSRVIVDKETEVIYGFPYSVDYQSNIEKDKDGNIYFSWDNMIYKLGTENPEHLQVEDYLPPNQSFVDWMINPEGICFYGNYGNDINNQRFKLPSGAIFPPSNLNLGTDLQLDFLSFGGVFYGFNGDYYFTKQTGHLTGKYNLYRINFNTDEAEVEFVTDFDPGYIGGVRFKRNTKKKTFFALQGGIHEFDEYTGTVRTYSLSSVSNDNVWGDTGFSAEHWVWFPGAGGNAISKISLMDYTTKEITLAPKGTHDFYDFAVHPKSGVISFSGLRYADGKNVLGKVDEYDNVTFQVVEQGKPVELVKLN